MDRAKQEIAAFIARLEAALNAHDADAYNRDFAADISWGTPNGEVLHEFATLHAVHKRFLEGPLRQSKFRYTIGRIENLGPDTAYAHVRLTRTDAGGSIAESDESCLYVFMRRDGVWRLCAGHNTRIQPRQAP